MELDKKTTQVNGIDYYGAPYIVDTVEELMNFFRMYDDVTVVTGERGSYEWHTYINNLETSFVNRVQLSMMTNEYFDQKDDRSHENARGGISRSYEYHVYVKTI